MMVRIFIDNPSRRLIIEGYPLMRFDRDFVPVPALTGGESLLGPRRGGEETEGGGGGLGRGNFRIVDLVVGGMEF